VRSETASLLVVVVITLCILSGGGDVNGEVKFVIQFIEQGLRSPSVVNLISQVHVTKERGSLSSRNLLRVILRGI